MIHFLYLFSNYDNTVVAIKLVTLFRVTKNRGRAKKKILYARMYKFKMECEGTSKAKAVSYVEIEDENKNVFWGVGIDTDIIVSSVKALCSAVNNLFSIESAP